MAPRKAETMESLFMQKVLTPEMPHSEAPRTVPGLAAAAAEDGSADDLNWWQATNVHRLCSFLANKKSEQLNNVKKQVYPRTLPVEFLVVHFFIFH